MNTALRAVHDLLRGTDKEQAWLSVAETGRRIAAQRGRFDEAGLRQWIAENDLHVSVTQWRTCLHLLGVIDSAGRLQPVATAGVGTALRLVADSFTAIPQPPTWDLVATVPATLARSVRPVVRRTAAVLLELFEQTRRYVIMTAPFIDTSGIRFFADAAADAGQRGVTVHILTTESSAGLAEPLVRRWADMDGTLVLSVLRTPDSVMGSHAKVVVSDDRRAYIGSANITSGGLSRHLELGVEVDGPRVADLARLLRAVAAEATTYHYGGSVRPRSAADDPGPPSRPVPAQGAGTRALPS